MDRGLEDAFAGVHPAEEFFFFVVAIGAGMFLVHPLYVGVSFAAASLYFFLLRGRKGAKTYLALLALWAGTALLNGALVQQGDTVLFTWLRGRAVTKEALCYGVCGGALFVTVMLWFACYHEIMTSDKFICLFGGMIPALSLLMSMILRLIPNFERKARGILGARRCIGKAPEHGTRKERLAHSMDALSVLTSWALEGAVVTADSMRSRGYGSGERVNFSVYRHTGRDAALLAVFLPALALLFLCLARGAAQAEFYPVMERSTGLPTAAGALGYAAFLFTPSFLHIGKEVTWSISKSRI